MSVNPSVGSDATSVGDEAPLTREVMKANIMNEMTSIQELIMKYQGMQQQLQEDVAGFVLREVDEENEMHALTASVIEEQQTSLRNPEYVRWAVAKEKGEFASGYGKAGSEAETMSEFSGLSQLPAEVRCAKGQLPLDAYPGVKQSLAGWRRSNSAIREQLRLLTMSLIPAAASKSASSKDLPRFVVVLNGQPVLSTAALQDSVAAAAVVGQTWATAEHAAAWWWAKVLQLSSVSSAVEAMELLTTSPTLRASLVEDAEDMVCVVPLDEAALSVPARLFVVNGELRSIEICDPKADVCRVLLSASSTPSSDVIDAMVFRSMESLIALLQSTWKSEGAEGESGRREVICVWIKRDASASDDGLQTTVMDVRNMSPTIPFLWHLSWADVCGFGKMTAAGACIALKRTRARLMTLEEGTDGCTKAWFPLINLQLSTSVSRPPLSESVGIPTTPIVDDSTTTSKPSSDSRTAIYAAICGAALAVAVSAISSSFRNK